MQSPPTSHMRNPDGTPVVVVDRRPRPRSALSSAAAPLAAQLSSQHRKPIGSPLSSETPASGRQEPVEPASAVTARPSSSGATTRLPPQAALRVADNLLMALPTVKPVSLMHNQGLSATAPQPSAPSSALSSSSALPHLTARDRFDPGETLGRSERFGLPTDEPRAGAKQQQLLQLPHGAVRPSPLPVSPVVLVCDDPVIRSTPTALTTAATGCGAAAAPRATALRLVESHLDAEGPGQWGGAPGQWGGGEAGGDGLGDSSEWSLRFSGKTSLLAMAQQQLGTPPGAPDSSRPGLGACPVGVTPSSTAGGLSIHSALNVPLMVPESRGRKADARMRADLMPGLVLGGDDYSVEPEGHNSGIKFFPPKEQGAEPVPGPWPPHRAASALASSSASSSSRGRCSITVAQEDIGSDGASARGGRPEIMARGGGGAVPASAEPRISGAGGGGTRSLLNRGVGGGVPGPLLLLGASPPPGGEGGDGDEGDEGEPDDWHDTTRRLGSGSGGAAGRSAASSSASAASSPPLSLRQVESALPGGGGGLSGRSSLLPRNTPPQRRVVSAAVTSSSGDRSAAAAAAAALLEGADEEVSASWGITDNGTLRLGDFLSIDPQGIKTFRVSASARRAPGARGSARSTSGGGKGDGERNGSMRHVASATAARAPGSLIPPDSARRLSHHPLGDVQRGGSGAGGGGSLATPASAAASPLSSRLPLLLRSSLCSSSSPDGSPKVPHPGGEAGGGDTELGEERDPEGGVRGGRCSRDEQPHQQLVDYDEEGEEEAELLSSTLAADPLLPVPRHGNVRADLVLLDNIGAGASAFVQRALHLPTLQLVAVKHMRILDLDRRSAMARELRTLYANMGSLGGRVGRRGSVSNSSLENTGRAGGSGTHGALDGPLSLGEDSLSRGGGLLGGGHSDSWGRPPLGTTPRGPAQTATAPKVWRTLSQPELLLLEGSWAHGDAAPGAADLAAPREQRQEAATGRTPAPTSSSSASSSSLVSSSAQGEGATHGGGRQGAATARGPAAPGHLPGLAVISASDGHSLLSLSDSFNMQSLNGTVVPDRGGESYRHLCPGGGGSGGSALRGGEEQQQAAAAAAEEEEDAASGVSCPYLVRFYDAYSDAGAGTVSIVMEYLGGGSLQEVVDAGGIQDEAALARIAAHVLRGLAFLHGNHQLHRDIKPGNILVSAAGDAFKVADFGITVELDGTHAYAQTWAGTMMYMSPEKLGSPEGYSYPSDVWSAGLSLLAVAAGRFPYDLHANMGFWDAMTRIHTDPPPLHVIDSVRPISTAPIGRGGGGDVAPPPGEDGALQWSPAFRSFLLAALTKDPAARPSAEALLAHPFIQSHVVLPPTAPGAGVGPLPNSPARDRVVGAPLSRAIRTRLALLKAQGAALTAAAPTASPLAQATLSQSQALHSAQAQRFQPLLRFLPYRERPRQERHVAVGLLRQLVQRVLEGHWDAFVALFRRRVRSSTVRVTQGAQGLLGQLPRGSASARSGGATSQGSSPDAPLAAGPPTYREVSLSVSDVWRMSAQLCLPTQVVRATFNQIIARECEGRGIEGVAALQVRAPQLPQEPASAPPPAAAAAAAAATPPQQDKRGNGGMSGMIPPQDKRGNGGMSGMIPPQDKRAVSDMGPTPLSGSRDSLPRDSLPGSSPPGPGSAGPTTSSGSSGGGAARAAGGDYAAAGGLPATTTPGARGAAEPGAVAPALAVQLVSPRPPAAPALPRRIDFEAPPTIVDFRHLHHPAGSGHHHTAAFHNASGGGGSSGGRTPASGASSSFAASASPRGKLLSLHLLQQQQPSPTTLQRGQAPAAISLLSIAGGGSGQLAQVQREQEGERSFAVMANGTTPKPQLVVAGAVGAGGSGSHTSAPSTTVGGAASVAAAAPAPGPSSVGMRPQLPEEEAASSSSGSAEPDYRPQAASSLPYYAEQEYPRGGALSAVAPSSRASGIAASRGSATSSGGGGGMGGGGREAEEARYVGRVTARPQQPLELLSPSVGPLSLRGLGSAASSASGGKQGPSSAATMPASALLVGPAYPPLSERAATGTPRVGSAAAAVQQQPRTGGGGLLLPQVSSRRVGSFDGTPGDGSRAPSAPPSAASVAGGSPTTAHFMPPPQQPTPTPVRKQQPPTPSSAAVSASAPAAGMMLGSPGVGWYGSPISALRVPGPHAAAVGRWPSGDPEQEGASPPPSARRMEVSLSRLADVIIPELPSARGSRPALWPSGTQSPVMPQHHSYQQPHAGQSGLRQQFPPQGGHDPQSGAPGDWGMAAPASPAFSLALGAHPSTAPEGGQLGAGVGGFPFHPASQAGGPMGPPRRSHTATAGDANSPITPTGPPQQERRYERSASGSASGTPRLRYAALPQLQGLQLPPPSALEAVVDATAGALVYRRQGSAPLQQPVYRGGEGEGASGNGGAGFSGGPGPGAVAAQGAAAMGPGGGVTTPRARGTSAATAAAAQAAAYDGAGGVSLPSGSAHSMGPGGGGLLPLPPITPSKSPRPPGGLAYR